MRALRLFLLPAAIFCSACYTIGDLGPAPFACKPDTNPDCPDGYTCDPDSKFCEHLCLDGNCPDGLTCSGSAFCIQPCQKDAECTTGFHCDTTLKECLPTPNLTH